MSSEKVRMVSNKPNGIALCFPLIQVGRRRAFKAHPFSKISDSGVSVCSIKNSFCLLLLWKIDSVMPSQHSAAPLTIERENDLLWPWASPRIFIIILASDSSHSLTGHTWIQALSALSQKVTPGSREWKLFLRLALKGFH